MAFTTLQQGASLLGASGVLLGAFGAHALQNRLTPAQLDVWKTAVQYQLIHAVAILSLSVLQETTINSRKRSSSGRLWYERAGHSLLTGTLLFSGSLYLLCLDGIVHSIPKKILGPMTPIGGLCLIAGWTMLFLGGSSGTSSSNPSPQRQSQ